MCVGLGQALTHEGPVTPTNGREEEVGGGVLPRRQGSGPRRRWCSAIDSEEEARTICRVSPDGMVGE